MIEAKRAVELGDLGYSQKSDDLIDPRISTREKTKNTYGHLMGPDYGTKKKVASEPDENDDIEYAGFEFGQVEDDSWKPETKNLI